MKKFHLFGGEHYYPGGGINDYLGSFERYEDAMQYVTDQKEKYRIYDVTGKAVNGEYPNRLDWFDILTEGPDGSLIDVNPSA